MEDIERIAAVCGTPLRPCGAIASAIVAEENEKVNTEKQDMKRC